MSGRIIYIFAAIMILTLSSCDTVKSFFGMPTSRDIAEMKAREREEQAEQQRLEEAARIAADSLRRADSVAQVQAELRRNTPLYHVITGSFKVAGNAEKMVELLTREGYAPRIIDFPNGFRAVSAYSSERIGEAYRVMDRIKETVYSPYDIWIYEEKPQ